MKINKKFLKIIMSFLLAIAVVPSFAFATDDEAMSIGTDVSLDASNNNRSTLVNESSGSSEKANNSVASVTYDTTTLYYTSLTTAISEATSESTVNLLSDISLTNTSILISKTLTIDLNSYTLSFTNSTSSWYCIGVYNGNLTINNGEIINESCKDNTDITAAMYTLFVQAEATLTTNNLTIQSYANNGISNYNYIVYLQGSYSENKLNVSLNSTTIQSMETTNVGTEIGVTICGYDTDGKDVDLSQDQNKSLSLNDCTINTSGFALTGNGARHGVSISIDQSTLTSTSSTAIYHPQYGNMTITNSTITGALCGIEVRAGNVNIKNSTVSSTTTNTATAAPNGNGTTMEGIGVAISQHTTNLSISVSIVDCTVSGACAVFEGDIQDDSTEDISLSIDGGTYTSTGTLSYTPYSSDNSSTTVTSTSAIAVYSEDVTQFITSGVFQSTATDADGNTTTTLSDVDSSYLSASSVAVYVPSKDATYVGKTDSISETLNDLDLGSDDSVIIVGAGSSVTSVTLTGLDGVTVSITSDISNTVSATINDETVTTEGTVTHDYDYSTIEFTFTETEDGVTVTATVKCSNYDEDGAYLTISSDDITLESETTEATCEADAYTTYTASYTYGDETYTGTYTVTSEGTATGEHSYEGVFSYTIGYDSDGSIIVKDVTLTLTCSVCGDVQTVEGTYSVTTVTEATETANGLATITLSATYDGVTYTNTDAINVELYYEAEEETTEEETTEEETTEEQEYTVEATLIDGDDEDSGSSTTTTSSSDTDESADTDTSDNTVMYIYALLGLTAACGAYYVVRRREEL